ncbi:O-antigen ligase family protein [Iodobacter fluviatilis]|uniref:O-antigen ligase n=1 Tax=Iodobacter fluviatilis TaxID=537 RepID=A0A377Q5N9_9NEIS|nr:O-antigen ligase family protein [Iodobacter fluviatilis]TCU81511.1 O-antigen ligase [Iodobacter fluviatilis]STQ89919.1 Lipid A core - O-antigen ligase and related enzymes [Iodobacter fluviatilis]
MINVLDSRRDEPLFWLLIAQICWAPLPLASNRTWALGILLCISLVLWLSAAVRYRSHWPLVIDRLKLFALPLGVLLALLCWTLLQATPLPFGLIQYLSPNAAQIWQSIAPDASATLSLNAAQTQLQAALCFIYGSAFLFTVLLVRSSRRMMALAYALLFMALFQALLGGFLYSFNAQYELFTSDVFHGRMLGTYVYHNNAAGMLAMCLSVGIGLFIVQLEKNTGSQHKKWTVNLLDFMLSKKMLLRLGLVILVIALVMTRSRMGNAGFFTAMLLSLALYAVFSPKVRKVIFILLISLVLIDIWILGQWVGLDKVVDRLEATQLNNSAKAAVISKAQQAGANSLNFVQPHIEESVEERTLPVAYAQHAVGDYFWTGSGAGTFYSIFPQYRPANSKGYYDHAHNDYVEILTDYGVMGASLFAILALSTLWQIVTTIKIRKHPVARGIALGVLMAMLEIFLHSLVDFNLQIPANALLFTVIIALGWSTAQVDKQTQHI